MNILVLQGPNLNLLGLKSSQSGKRLTLDKLNKSLKSTSKEIGSNLKFLQTHKQFLAINFLQRNRNWANGLLFIPTSWAKTEVTILETINLIKINTAAIYFNQGFSFGTNEDQSIFIGPNTTPFTGDPVLACTNGLKFLLS